MIQAGIIDKIELAPRVVHLTIAASCDLSWQSGQYITLGMDGHEPRPYSIAGQGKDASQVSLHIAPSGLGRLSDALFYQAQPGDDIRIGGIFGTTSVDHLRREKRRVVMIAGGTGLAPVTALMRDMDGKDVVIYHAARDIESFYAPAIGLDAIAVLESEGQMPHQAVPFDDHKDAVFYLAGPPAMIAACKDTMLAKGIDSASIFHD